MSEEKKVKVGNPIINNIYSGFCERVYFTGMPSKDAFSITYQTTRVSEDPTLRAISSHEPNTSTINIQKNLQIFYPLPEDGRTIDIEFPSRSKCKFSVKSVSLKSLIAIIE